MSGIAGIIHCDGAPVEPGQIEGMTATMVARGPDGISHRSSPCAAFGHCMLRTTPEAAEETQPLASEDGTLVLVMDGRVDNWEELRRELLAGGAVLRSRSDAELVLRAWQHWGAGFLAHIDGDFALVLWDETRRTAVCARDRIGHRQLHYHWNGRTLSFASELQALLTLPWINAVPNLGVIAEYLAVEMLSPDETPWQGILRLRPAHQMTVAEGHLATERYWQPDLWQTLPCRSDAEYREYYLALFEDIVRRQSRASGPLACEVSGGIDSSAIYAMAERLQSRRALLAPGLQGYTLGFHDPGDAHELGFAHAVGRFWGRAIREVPPTRQPLDWYRAEGRRLRHFAGYPNGVMGQGLRQQARADGSRVLLIGVGGDEWLGGSRAYYAEALAEGNVAELHECLRRDWREAGAGNTLRWLLLQGLLPLLPEVLRRPLRAVQAMFTVESTLRERWLQPELRQLLHLQRQRFRPPPQPPLRRIGQRGQLNMLVGGYYGEALDIEELSIAQQGMELRRPYLHPAMIQFALSSPERLRQQGRLDRALHRSAMAGLLPEEVRLRTSKAEFSITLEWLLPELRELVRTDTAFGRRGWVDERSLAALVEPGKTPDYRDWGKWMLWALFCCDAMVGE